MALSVLKVADRWARLVLAGSPLSMHLRCKFQQNYKNNYNESYYDATVTRSSCHLFAYDTKTEIVKTKINE